MTEPRSDHHHDDDPVPISLAIDRWRRSNSVRHWTGRNAGHYDLCALTSGLECDLDCLDDITEAARAEAIHRTRAANKLYDVPDDEIARLPGVDWTLLTLRCAVINGSIIRGFETLTRALAKDPRP